jgi:cell shape-determining protein MreC
MNAMEGIWLSISDYSRYKNVSVSTIRRHIKNKILKFKEENGKYFIYVASPERVRAREEEETLKLRLELELLRSTIRQLRDENAELKMLVDLYEAKPTAAVSRDLPPDLPRSL